jgi:hypothetical protein
MQSRVAAAPALGAGTDGAVVHAGALVERVAGSEVGRIRYCQTRVQDGGWLVEETGRSTADSLHSWGGTSFTRLALSSSLELVEAERRSESFLGTEECRIQQDEDGGYVAQVTELDGFQGELRLDGPLVAGEDLALTAVSCSARAGRTARSRCWGLARGPWLCRCRQRGRTAHGRSTSIAPAPPPTRPTTSPPMARSFAWTSKHGEGGGRSCRREKMSEESR